ncbi:MAG: response regulator, partial [Planctomycetes bacterium]|nr:response regulator [Planctomycetota bacterium]
VDDDMRNTFALSKSLQGSGMRVCEADNGEVALSKLEEDQEIELVIMDIMMPVMDGYEAMRRIRKIEKYAELPIIALTANSLAEDRAQCMDAGANDYITKPLDYDKLMVMIKVWLFR